MPKNLSPNENQIARVDNRVLESFVKSNDLTAFKVLMYIGKSQLDKDRNIHDLDDEKLYKVPIRLQPLSNYYTLTTRQIREGIIKLNETSINYRKQEKGKDVESFVNLLPKAKINYTDETFECFVFGEILKLVFAINKYSEINVKNFIRLEKKHSGKMLMLVERISNYKKTVTYTDPDTFVQTKKDIMPKRQHYELDELNKMFGTKYKTYSLFVKKVLQPCKEDLDAHSQISFMYTAVKDRVGDTVKSRGRTPIVHITIDVIGNNNLFTQ